jgi:malate dehydrogenase
MKIGIIGGAGTVGSCAAYTLASRGIADEIVLIDLRNNVAASHAADIAASVTGRRPVSIRTGNYGDLEGADIIIIAVGLHYAVSAPLNERMLQNIINIKEIAEKIESICPGAIIITVTNPSDIMNYAVYQATSLPREHVIGYNLNDSLRFKMITARILGFSPQRIECLAGGYHPQAQVMFFSSLKVDGQQYSLSKSQKDQIQFEMLNYLKSFDALKADRTAGWTTASGLCQLVAALKSDQPTLMGCSAIMRGEYGFKDIGIGVPVIISRQGILNIEEWQLPDDEKQELERVAAIIESNCELVRKTLKSARK